MQTDRPTGKVGTVSRVTRISVRALRPDTQKPGDRRDVGGTGSQVSWLLAGCDQADNKEINKESTALSTLQHHGGFLNQCWSGWLNGT